MKYMRQNYDDTLTAELRERMDPERDEPVYRPIWRGRICDIPPRYWGMQVYWDIWSGELRRYLVGVIPEVKDAENCKQGCRKPQTGGTL